MTKHSNVMGGSTAARRINCPGSYLAEKGLPSTTSEFADRGSMLHAVMEQILLHDKTPEEMLGEDMGFHGHTLTEDLIEDKISPALGAWESIVREHDLTEWLVEVPVSMESVVPGAFGTSDVIARDSKGRLHVIDWKFGDGVVVPAKNNFGLGFYAAAAFADPAPDLVEFTEGVRDVWLHIVQPRIGGGDALSSWQTNVDWLGYLAGHAAASAAIAQKPGAPLKAGSWCRFCKAGPTCPARMEQGGVALSMVPADLDVVTLGKALEMASALETWIKEVRQRAHLNMEAGAAVPGYKLVDKRASRVWADVDVAEQVMVENGVSADKRYVKKFVSPAQAEKLDKKLFANVLSDLVVYHSSGTTIAPDADKRPAINNSMSVMASALPKRNEGDS